jgi:hypothetical protein
LDVKKRFSEEQSIGFLKEAGRGMAVKDTPYRRRKGKKGAPLKRESVVSCARWLIAATASVATCIAMAGAPALRAGGSSPAEQSFWRAAAIVDVEGAYRMLQADHPGAVPEVGDTRFRETLTQAHTLAAQRATHVTSFSGYAATLAGFANAFGDKHIRSRPVLEIAYPDWAGVIIGRRSGRWVVADAEQGSAAAGLLGSELIECDDRPADDWARQLLGGFRADWSVEAQRVQAAAWLLVSEGNPFTPRPRSCVFGSANGRRSRVTLDWRSISRADLAVRMSNVSTFGAAGFGVRRTGKGYWIALQDLVDRAQPVVDAVRVQASQIRQSPFVVLDLRGNGGGSSLVGDEIAAAILGADYVRAIQGPPVADCGGEVFRVSADNVRALQRDQEWGRRRGAEMSSVFADVLTRMRAAQATGRPFSGALSCPQKPGSESGAIAPEYKGKLFLLTDGLCFSSCLDVVASWRRLGAVQLGQPTDADTHYSAVRDELMPSGLSTFSTMMGIEPGAPMRIGPFSPECVYAGDIRDTSKIESWVLELMTRVAHSTDHSASQVRGACAMR